MTKLDGVKDIYLLGAGASADAGAPINRHFLDDNYLDKNLKIKELLSTRDYKRFDIIRHIAKQIFLNPQDIEIFLNGTSSAIFLGMLPEKFEELWGIPHNISEEIKWYMLTIIHLSLIDSRIKTENLKSYEKFYRKLDANTDCVISFNYDLMPDHFLLKEKGELNYHLLEGEVTFSGSDMKIFSGIPLLKLHGSMNWLICSNKECSKISICYDDIAHKVDESGFHIKCKNCSSSLMGLIIPPLWNKNEIYSNILQRLWQVARSKLEFANNLFVVGYSLPESDIYARYLLAFVLKNSDLNINIININDETNEKYKMFFEQINIKSDRCTFLPYSFKEYIDYNF